MGRMDELAITMCIGDLIFVNDDWTEAEIEKVNVRISETLGVELRDYLRRVDDALSLIPDGWAAEITWETTPKQASVVLSTANLDRRGTMHRCVSDSFRNGVKVHYPLPISICRSALNAHLVIREREKKSGT
jgi:hypothetical protein